MRALGVDVGRRRRLFLASTTSRRSDQRSRPTRAAGEPVCRASIPARPPSWRPRIAYERVGLPTMAGGHSGPPLHESPGTRIREGAEGLSPRLHRGKTGNRGAHGSHTKGVA